MSTLGKIFLSFFFIGKIPHIPGTAASLVTCLLIFLLREREYTFHLAIFFILLLSSIFFLRRSGLRFSDPRWVVIDEVIGMYMTMLGRPIEPANLLVGFMSFRFFDIMKPYPVGNLERLGGEWGILLDDIASGILSNFLLYLFEPILGN